MFLPRRIYLKHIEVRPPCILVFATHNDSQGAIFIIIGTLLPSLSVKRTRHRVLESRPPLTPHLRGHFTKFVYYVFFLTVNRIEKTPKAANFMLKIYNFTLLLIRNLICRNTILDLRRFANYLSFFLN